MIAPDYGKSTDEGYEYLTADLALEIYTSTFTEHATEKYQARNQDQYYGTASTAAVLAVQKLVFPNTNQETNIVAHYCYFLFYLAAIVAIFYLGKLFFNEWISFFIAALFATQPLLFGHAFINPKDIPVLSTFLLAAVLGFHLVNRWIQTGSEYKSDREQASFKSINHQKKQRLFLGILVGLVILFLSSSLITDLVIQLVEYSYKTQDSSFFGKIFAAQTTSGSLEGYRMLAGAYLLQFYRYLSFVSPAILAVIFVFAQRNQLFNNKINLYLFLAAAAWGFAVSTRVLAIAVGGMVGIYALIKMRGKAIIPLTIYTLTAAIFSAITWPYIWVYGIRGYFDSLATFNKFPWTGLILFEGQSYLPVDLPANYLPKLMALQFTEPFVIMTLLGILIGLNLLLKKQVDRPILLIISAWFFIPLLYTIIGNPTIYTNFRHLLFITPPLFIFSGFAVQQLAIWLKNKSALVIICIGLILPGAVSIINLHPYQYIYYNEFIGGVEGASPDYEMDYWSTAFIDAMEFINENVSPGSRVLVWKDNLSASVYATNQFGFSAHTEIPEEEYPEFDYAIVPTNRIEPDSIFAEYPIAYSVDVDHVSIIVVLKIPSVQN
ncbi:MAG: hypothetical protein ABFS17_00820 [Chloroflexota bacterium]